MKLLSAPALTIHPTSAVLIKNGTEELRGKKDARRKAAPLKNSAFNPKTILGCTRSLYQMKVDCKKQYVVLKYDQHIMERRF
jgi:hypothetical protein